MSDGKRRLPLVKEPEPAREEDAERPGWHWTLIGAVAIGLGWLILEMIAIPLIGAVDPGAKTGPPTRPGLIAAHLLALTLASFAGGLFVGKFGVQAGRRHAALAGAAAIVPPWLFLSLQAGAVAEVPLLAVVLAILGGSATGAAYLGGRVGIRLR